MRLAFCIFKHFPFGGLQRDMLKMVRECLRRGHDVRIYAIHWRDESGPPAGVELCLAPVRALSNHRLYEKFAAWVRRDLGCRPVDLVVGMNKMPGLDAYYAGDTCYQEKALTQRTFLHRLLPRHRSLLQAERAVFDAGSGTEILTLADAQAQAFQRCYNTQPERFHRLPPGIERDRAAPADKTAVRRRVRRQLGLSGADRLLLFVGSGFATKGLDRLLRGLQSLPQQLLDETLLAVVGEDNARPFQRMARRLGISQQVRFMGGRADVPDFLLAADGFVLPAYNENTGTTILEAMIAGVPALVTENCGYARYVRDFDAGLVTPSPFDQDVFNGQLAELLTSADRQRWSGNGAALAADESIHQMASTAVDLLERFAERPSRCMMGRAADMADVYLSPTLTRRFDESELIDWAWSVEGDVHRQVKGRSTLRLSLEGRGYFLKRHLGVGWGEILKNWTVGKKAVLGAENEYRACLHLARHDVRAPRVAAFAAERGSPARRRSFVLCGELVGFDSLEKLTEAWPAEPPAPKAQRRLVVALARFVRRLHEIGLAHRDLYICHLLIDREKWAAGKVELAVLDLHRALVQAPIPPFWRRRDLAALLFSTLHLNLPRFSQLRFVRIYTGRPLRETFQRDLRFWRGVERRARVLWRKDERSRQAPRPAAEFAGAPHK